MKIHESHPSAHTKPGEPLQHSNSSDISVSYNLPKIAEKSHTLLNGSELTMLDHNREMHPVVIALWTSGEGRESPLHMHCSPKVIFGIFTFSKKQSFQHKLLWSICFVFEPIVKWTNKCWEKPDIVEMFRIDNARSQPWDAPNRYCSLDKWWGKRKSTSYALFSQSNIWNCYFLWKARFPTQIAFRFWTDREMNQ